MALVMFEREVRKLKVIDTGLAAVFNHERWAGQGRALQLGLHLLDRIKIDMGIANGVDELAWHKACDLGDQMQEQRVGRYVKRHTEEHVRRALIHLQRQGVARYKKLEKVMAGRQRDRVSTDFCRIPGVDYNASGGWVVTDKVNGIGQLVHNLPEGVCQARH